MDMVGPDGIQAHFGDCSSSCDMLGAVHSASRAPASDTAGAKRRPLRLSSRPSLDTSIDTALYRPTAARSALAEGFCSGSTLHARSASRLPSTERCSALAFHSSHQLVHARQAFITSCHVLASAQPPSATEQGLNQLDSRSSRDANSRGPQSQPWRSQPRRGGSDSSLERSARLHRPWESNHPDRTVRERRLDGYQGRCWLDPRVGSSVGRRSAQW